MRVEIRDVWKRYPGTWALRGVSLTVETGRVLGVLGENGCGKSTLFRILAGATRLSKGSVALDEQPVGVDTRRRVAFLPEIDPFYNWMRVMEQLEFLSAFYPAWDMDKSREEQGKSLEEIFENAWRYREDVMLTRAVGLVLILIGIAIGLPVLSPLLVSAATLAWHVLEMAAVGVVVYMGYRLLRPPRSPAG